MRQRREQVLERFAAFGLRHGPHRIVGTGRIWEGEASLGVKLRLALGELGPIFSAFGRYLATRVDLLAAADCLELEAITDDSPPMSDANVSQLIKREIGCAPEEAFLSFEKEPFASRLLHQLHHARLLQTGMPVVVKLVRPEATAQLLCDLELLELLEMVIEGPARGGVYNGAIADFAAELRRQVDLTCEAKAFETLRRDVEDFEMVRVPEVMGALCTPSILTTEHLTSMSHKKNGVLDRQGVARLLCSAWLRQALMGHIFPVDPCAGNVAVISDRQIAFTGGVFSSLPGESQANLWNYLIASASDRPDQACSCLLKEVRGDGPAAAHEDLRHRFRQVVPFRDSGWYSDDNSNQLIEHLVVHWQAAIQCGYVPQLHLPSFCRGLFAITRMAQQLSPETDPLLEGLQEARLLESAARMREMFSFQHLGDHVDRYAALMMGMPQKMDQALTLASEGSTRVKLRVPETASHQRQKNSGAIVTAMLLLLVAVAFALPRVTSSLVGSDWAGRINAVAFVACGALLLLATGRAR
ncbi:MAG TPA: AarF/UbiB family protein [Pyrinomonadaceae bacterium]|nr:AarF/UbiB family protein [Pyrinomonadaceae bacterium]